MTPLIVAVALAATPKLAVPSFTGGRADLASFCSERIADELQRVGFEVVTEKQIGALLGMERQRQLIGCSSEGSECMAELTNALGADGLVSGTLVVLGRRIEIDVRVFSAKTGNRLAVAHGEAASEEDIPAVLAKLAEELGPAVRGEAPPTKRSVPRFAVWVPIGLGVAGAVASVVTFGLARELHQNLTMPDPFGARLTATEGMQRASAMVTYQSMGWVFAGIATAALLTGLVLLIIRGGP